MEKISKWVSRHIFLARVLLVTGHLVLIILAYLLEANLQKLNFHLPEIGFYSVLLLALLTFFIYHSASRRSAKWALKNNSVFRKVCHFVLLVFSFIAIVYCFSAELFTATQPKVNASVLIKDSLQYRYAQSSIILQSLSYRGKQSLSKTEKKVLGRELKYQSKKYAKSKLHNDDKNGNAALRIILITLLALGLMVLLLALGVAMAFAGLELLAVITLIVGLAGIFFLAAVLIRKVRLKKKPSH